MTRATARYEQSTGKFQIFATVDDAAETERCIYETHGYAGSGSHKNRPGSSHVRGKGPLPTGTYLVRLGDHPRFAKPAFKLQPYATNTMHGRSGFWIHGDSYRDPGNASSGCIILARHHREAVLEYGVRYLEVVPGPTEG